MTHFQHISTNKLVVILRGLDPEVVPDMVQAMYNGGLRSVEITLNSAGALSLIEKLAIQMPVNMLIGAGTVLSADEASAAINAGAEFIISPNVDEETIAVTKKLNKLSIPGAFTPTEIFSAYKMGGEIIKVFPSIEGSRYIKAIKGPFPQIPLMPTGGIHSGNFQEYLDAGAIAFGIGGALVNKKEPVSDKYLQQLQEKTAAFIQLLTASN